MGQVGFPASPQGPKLNSHTSFSSAALIFSLMELIFAPNVFFSNTETLVMSELIFSKFRNYSDFKDFGI